MHLPHTVVTRPSIRVEGDAEGWNSREDKIVGFHRETDISAERTRMTNDTHRLLAHFPK